MNRLLTSTFILPFALSSLLAQDPVTFVNHDGPPPGAKPYVPKPPPEAGQHLQQTMDKFENGFSPARPFKIWALGSSYTNMIGSGEVWQEEIPKQFPKAPPIEYKKMVGNSCPWLYLRGWARHLVYADQPDLFITYTIGDPKDLDLLLADLRKHTTADIIVPSIHWRMRDEPNWGKSEDAVDQNVAAVREVCAKHGAEFVENRRDWAAYLKEHDLPIQALLKDAVHQNTYGAHIINSNILSHLRRPASYPETPKREKRISAKDLAESAKGFKLEGEDLVATEAGATLTVSFEGNRIELIGVSAADAGKLKVKIDGKPADEAPAFLATYIQGDKTNKKTLKTDNPRDMSPHGVTLADTVVPQDWTIVMTSDAGDYTLTGSITGKDGEGNAFKPFTSSSGQIQIEPELWRRAERNGKGDRFTFSVQRVTVPEVSFVPEEGAEAGAFRIRLANMLKNGPHTLELTTADAKPVRIRALDVFQPPAR
ncbi:hypothetical protein WJU23_22920 [Prosthecobacter sp. SYSU 5D2]|uniref:hypothetical protein n=1 Tax=Prosthecobacter sp. SYSU 5D2 TaxID=3134134 RepID=UPI0031FF17AC